MKKTNKSLVAAAITGMLSATVTLSSPAQASTPAKAKAEQAPCYGVNECSGKGNYCAVPGSHSCHGHNSCKGKGLKMMDKEACLKAGGQVADAAWKKKMSTQKKKG